MATDVAGRRVWRAHRLRGLQVREAIEGYVCILPWVLGFLLFTAGPLLASLYFSLGDYDMMTYHWIGLGNYRGLFFRDPRFMLSLYNTVYYTVFSVPLRLVAALFVALLLNLNMRGMHVLRTVYYLPSITPTVAASVLWMWLLNPQYGLVNALLAKLGLPTPGWLGDPQWAKPAFVLMSLWGIGGEMVIFLAGLQSIPEELYEAALVDGANPWHQFWNVTVPMISPVIFFNLIIGMIGSFQVFNQAYIMTGGGPLNATLFYVLYLYRYVFEYFRLGRAAAQAWILFVIVLVLTLLQSRFVGRRVYYAE